MWTVVVLLGLLVLDASGTRAQPTTRTAGTQTNLFGTIDPARAVDGIRLEVPEEWTVEAIHLLRYGTQPVPVRLRRVSSAVVLALAEGAVQGPHEFVARVRLPEAVGRRTWAVEPVARTSEGENEEEFRAVGRQTYTVDVVGPSRPSPTNRALSLGDAAGPVVLRPESFPSLRGDAPFTIEFWMRTTGLDEVVLSTWTGDEALAYPAEFFVDRSGRLRFYSGRPGEHQALWSGTPVADGAWHHVAAVYNAERSRLRLVLDGTVVDSLRNYRPPLPPRSPPMALGGRVPSDDAAPGAPNRAFSGHLDAVRLWPRARPTAALQGELHSSSPGSEEEGLALGFDADPDEPEAYAMVDRWPDGAQRVRSTRSNRAPLRDLQAQSDGQSVTLRWRARPSEASTFTVERSTDRQTFEPVARLQPEDAQNAPAADGAVEFAYTDASAPERVVFYRIRREDNGETTRTSATIKVGIGAEADDTAPVELIRNVPNPFSETTTIAYRVREPTPVTLSVWTVTGTRVKTLVDRQHDTGYYEQPFDASDQPSGSYFVRLSTPQGTQSLRMVLLK